MAFLKGLMSEEMEVKVVAATESLPQRDKRWERDYLKHIQRDVSLDKLTLDNSWDSFQ